MKPFKAITASQYETFERHFKLPKLLFESSRYKDMRLDTKVAYSILRDRLDLSFKNNWIDDKGSIYLVYSNANLAEILGCSKSTLLRIKKELAKYGLIKEVQQSNDKNGSLANRIYLANLIVDDELEMSSKTPVSNSNRGGAKKTPPRCQNEAGRVSELRTNETEYSETEYSDYYSSRNAEKISDEISQPAGTDSSSSFNNSNSYIAPKYYSLLQVIADQYNGKFTQMDLFTGEFQNYSLTHRQKMLIGQYLSEGYVTSQEVLNMIDRIPIDCEHPLAYLLKMLENLKEERRLEAKAVAHAQAKLRYGNHDNEERK